MKKLGPRFPRGFENVSHLNGGYGAVADVTCSPAGCFSNGRFAANASRQLLTPAFKSLRLTNDPANIRRPRSRQDREEEIPGLCNPRASGLDIDTQFLTNHRSIEYVPKVRGVCNDDYTRSNWNAVLHREERNGAWITKREIYRVQVARKICANRKSKRWNEGMTKAKRVYRNTSSIETCVSYPKVCPDRIAERSRRVIGARVLIRIKGKTDFDRGLSKREGSCFFPATVSKWSRAIGRVGPAKTYISGHVAIRDKVQMVSRICLRSWPEFMGRTCVAARTWKSKLAWFRGRNTGSVRPFINLLPEKRTPGMWQFLQKTRARLVVAAFSAAARFDWRRSRINRPCCTREECTQETLRRVDLPRRDRLSTFLHKLSPLPRERAMELRVGIDNSCSPSDRIEETTRTGNENG